MGKKWRRFTSFPVLQNEWIEEYSRDQHKSNPTESKADKRNGASDVSNDSQSILVGMRQLQKKK